ncbi:hypothetical protein [Halomonas sp. B23F22_10]|uniref:hypothetical protein n=1 Tax=Halomonas sp. B23F22_10 TaxID=3459515 RepID=UPI00373E1D8D
MKRVVLALFGGEIHVVPRGRPKTDPHRYGHLRPYPPHQWLTADDEEIHRKGAMHGMPYTAGMTEGGARLASRTSKAPGKAAKRHA